MQTLADNQILEIPPGNYNSSDCGINITANNVVLRASFGTVVIDCSASERQFIISGSNVTIDGIILRHGSSYMDECAGDHLLCPHKLDGGCILIFGNHTTVKNCSLMGCWAAQHGGALSIVNEDSFVLLQRTNVSHSDAAHGGGLWSRGLLELEDCVLVSNTARMHGGAVSAQGPRTFLAARRTLLSNNAALYGQGGAISLMVSNQSSAGCTDAERLAASVVSAYTYSKNNNYGLSGALTRSDLKQVAKKGIAGFHLLAGGGR